jgi:P-type Ca2+ transporter type 2C
VMAFGLDMFVWYQEGAKGFPLESVAIAAILLFNAILGTFQEYRAEAALSHLKQMAAPQVWVLREGVLAHLPSRELVPGDIVRLEAGDRIPADAILVSTDGVMTDESLLTGESVPLDKGETEEVYSGTLLVRGKAFAEVTRTGTKSALGQLSEKLSTLETEKTPLEKRLTAFSNQIARWFFVLAAAIVVLGVLFEGPGQFSHMLIFAVALAVAAIPEGLPAVLTLTLALGIQRMARRKAVIRRMSAVEALGSVTVIATDKTGTLTENRMRVQQVDAQDRERALDAMIFANEADLATEAGDPLDKALLDYAQLQGVDVAARGAGSPHISSKPFDSAHKYMRVTVQAATGVRSDLKGAPEVLLQRSRLSEAEQAPWREKIEAGAAEGYRMLALACREGESEEELDFLGLVRLWDPPRPEVKEAVLRAQEAGIRVLMITGDHPATALAIAEQVGIVSSGALTGSEIEALSPEALRRALETVSVFARVSAEDKLRLVEALKAGNQVVAMTGDGVNDALALQTRGCGCGDGAAWE